MLKMPMFSLKALLASSTMVTVQERKASESRLWRIVSRGYSHLASSSHRSPATFIPSLNQSLIFFISPMEALLDDLNSLKT